MKITDAPQNSILQKILSVQITIKQNQTQLKIIPSVKDFFQAVIKGVSLWEARRDREWKAGCCMFVNETAWWLSERNGCKISKIIWLCMQEEKTKGQCW